MKLIIVESPAKARTIEKFLGSEYKVVASYGHVRDLPSSASEIPAKFREKPWARLGVDTDGGYVPIYVVSKDSKKHVASLKKLLAQADELLLAIEEDREGEAISWHLLEVLKPKIPVRRITFHEITKEAIAKALTNPRDVDSQLVRAQESRRILDRLYGYSLSPVLWKKVRTKLSAGRVQSVAVRLIVEREEERQLFHTAEYWGVDAQLTAGDLTFEARLISVDGMKLATGKDFDPNTGGLKDARKLVLLAEETALGIASAVTALPWQVARLECKESRQRPSPPFITSTLQQAASSKLGMSPKMAMRVAQRLYEGIALGGGVREGLITYMRTDSLTLSEKALSEATTFIRQQFGPEYTTGPRRYKTKAKSAQEAHEAIRPTSIHRIPDTLADVLQKEELAMYHLIWNRTLASQMAEARLDKTTVDFVVDNGDQELVFRANGSVVRLPGFLKVYGGGQADSLLPDLSEGQTFGANAASSTDQAGVSIDSVAERRHETTPPARFTEASLVKKLEEEGIGRPSTYAPVISTIQQRDYVIKKAGSLLPTYIGMAVMRLLRHHFPQYVDLKFTAQMEEDLDAIAAGEKDWVGFLSKFYQGNGEAGQGLLARITQEMPEIEFPAIPLGEESESSELVTIRIGRNYVYVQMGQGEEAQRATVPVDLLIDELTLDKAKELIAARVRSREPLGKDPVSGMNVYVLVGPYGPYAQLGEAEKDKKPKRASLPRGKRTKDVGLDEALRLLSLPRFLGEDPESGMPVTAGLGRFGPFVARDRVFAKLDSEEQIYSVTLDEALERIRNKYKKSVIRELGNHPESGLPLLVVKGRYGPYVTDGKINAALGKQTDPSELTVQQATSLMAEAAQNKKDRGKQSSNLKDSTQKTSKKTAKMTRKKTAKKSAKKVGKKISVKPEKSTKKST